MNNWTDQKATQKLTKKQIKKITDKAYSDMIGLILVEKLPPREAIAAAIAAWEPAYYEVLSKAFSDTLQKSVGVDEIKAYRVGKVNLSAKLYKDAAIVTRDVENIIQKHAQGWQDVKKLSLDLFDGYAPIAEPIKWDTRNTGIAKSVRDAVLSDHPSKSAIIKITKRYADSLKTPALRAAYMEALDAAENGIGGHRLKNKLDVAFNEKMRYQANRIAQTEMQKVWQNAQLEEIQDDPEITAVQFKMSSTHAVEDICDVYARQDKYGLGVGMYPVGKAPVPPLHPFCRCRLVTKRAVDGTKGVEIQDSERRFLQVIAKKNAQLAGRIAGSQSKLKSILKGSDFTEVQNASRDPVHAIRQVGGAPPVVPPVKANPKPTKTNPVTPKSADMSYTPKTEAELRVMAANDFKTAAQAASQELIEKGRLSGREGAIVLDDAGGTILKKGGNENSVLFTKAEMQDIAKNGAQLIHNHPGGSPLSIEDIIMAARGDFGITAVSSADFASSFTARTYKIAKNRVNSFQSYILSAESMFDSAVRPKMIAAIKSGDLTIRQAEMYHQHLQTKIFQELRLLESYDYDITESPIEGLDVRVFASVEKEADFIDSEASMIRKTLINMRNF